VFSMVLFAASCAAAATKSLTLRPWIWAARLMTVSASGALRALIHAVRLDSRDTMRSFQSSVMYRKPGHRPSPLISSGYMRMRGRHVRALPLQPAHMDANRVL
jgi:hypothetical protein